MSKCYDHCIIISRYNENIDWVYKLVKKETWIQNILIVNKGDKLPFIKNFPQINIINTKNIGREGETYLTYIIENYNNLPDKLWFVQANPFDHSPDYINLLSKKTTQLYIKNKFQTLSWRYNEIIPPNFESDQRFFINKNRVVQYFIDSRTQQTVEHHQFYDVLHEVKVKELKKITPMPYGNYLHYMCGHSSIKTPKQIIPYCWSAIFFVRKEGILLNKKSSYESLRQLLLSSNLQGGYQGFVLERLWNYLFTHNSYNSVDDLKKITWNYSDICGCWNKNYNFISLFSKSYLIHPDLNPPSYSDDSDMIYYNILTKTFDIRKGVYYQFDASAIIPCLNIQTAKTIISFNMDIENNKFDPFLSIGNMLNNIIKPQNKQVQFDEKSKLYEFIDNFKLPKKSNILKKEIMLDKIGALHLKNNSSFDYSDED